MFFHTRVRAAGSELFICCVDEVRLNDPLARMESSDIKTTATVPARQSDKSISAAPGIYCDVSYRSPANMRDDDTIKPNTVKDKKFKGQISAYHRFVP